MTAIDQFLAFLKGINQPELASVGTIRVPMARIQQWLSVTGHTLSYLKAEACGYGRTCSEVMIERIPYLELRKANYVHKN